MVARLRSFRTDVVQLLVLTSLLFVVKGHIFDGDLDSLPRTSPSLPKREITQQDRTFYKFITRPDIDAPVFNLTIHQEDAVAPGFWFLSPYGAIEQDRPGQKWDGPHIYNGEGELVWSGTSMFGYWNVFDFESRIVHGERMLTLMSEHEGYGFVLDKSYTVYKKVPLLLDGQSRSNMHEFNVLDDGRSALFLTNTDGAASLEESRSIGFDGKCLARYQGFREVDVDSTDANEVVFDWGAKDHIGLDEVTFRKYDGSIKQQCERGWDILHLNSVDKFPDGDYLLSARHTDAVYKISHIDGSIVWRLGGVKSDFQQDGWVFSRQHHALVLEQNTTHTLLSLFDNGRGDDNPFEHPTNERARALDIRLDTEQMTATIAGTYYQPSGERTNSRGSFQTLPNGNKFICWAYNSYMSEHAPDGSLVMEARLPIKLRGYRAFKHPWTGSPALPPDVHSRAITVDDRTRTVIHVSWNGDTETHRWEFDQLLEDGTVGFLGAIKRSGFETRFEFDGYAERVFAVAYDADNNRLGKSEISSTVMPSDLNEGDSATSHDSDSALHYEVASQKPVAHSAAESRLPQSAITYALFFTGLISGTLICILLWSAIRILRARRAKSTAREDDEAKHALLEGDSD